MRYTLWSQGELVGESDLSYVSGDDDLRHGHFIPSEHGAALMASATGVPAAAMALARAACRIAESTGTSRYGHLTQYADLMAAINRRESLAFELRDDTGRVIETDWIDIRDIDVVLFDDTDDFAYVDDIEDDLREDDGEIQAAIEHDARLIAEWFDAKESGNCSTADFDPKLDAEDDFGPREVWKVRDDGPEPHWYHITVMLRGGDRRAARRANARST